MNASARGAGTSSNEDDVLTLILIGTGLVAFGVVNVGAISSSAVHWLIDHRVLVHAGQGLFDVPGGAAVDLPRLAAAAGLLLVLAAVAAGRRRTKQSTAPR